MESVDNIKAAGPQTPGMDEAKQTKAVRTTTHCSFLGQWWNDHSDVFQLQDASEPLEVAVSTSHHLRSACAFRLSNRSQNRCTTKTNFQQPRRQKCSHNSPSLYLPASLCAPSTCPTIELIWVSRQIIARLSAASLTTALSNDNNNNNNNNNNNLLDIGLSKLGLLFASI